MKASIVIYCDYDVLSNIEYRNYSLYSGTIQNMSKGIGRDFPKSSNHRTREID